MKRLSEYVLLVVGVGLVLTGVCLMFTHQQYEAHFQEDLLTKFGPDYHWRSVGGAYFGISTIVVGAFMTAFSALLELMNRKQGVHQNSRATDTSTVEAKNTATGATR